MDAAARQQFLSPRLKEVAQLVAAGLTDREIGVQLSLKTNTVSHYVQFNLWRLRLSKRSEIARRFAASPTVQRPTE
jgi:DNA-binding NarL/FixJ family response regulator